jgi:hypothetical protein
MDAKVIGDIVEANLLKQRAAERLRGIGRASRTGSRRG